MLQITVDIFSGRPNPVWLIDDNEEIQAILKDVATNREVIGQTMPEFERLGYRGVSLELLADDLEREYDLPASFAIANGTSGDESKGLEIATRLVENMSRFSPMDETRAVLTPLDEDLQKLLLNELASFPKVISKAPAIARLSEPDPSGIERKALDLSEEAKQAKIKGLVCYIELGWFNPGFWNNNSHVRRNNNCYNYARNWRTDTFAQPGRASGHYPYAITCNNVTDAALSDGAHRRYDCFPDSERPRWLMAMAVWPPGVDYHWYRKHREGFWGHKPGGTRARNYDQSGHTIYNPRVCDRGNYTDFCGYFYACRSMRIR
jgi:hypothetical protein